LPSDYVQFLSLDEALAIHERLIERFGGTPGVRDMGLLESALFRPRTGYYEDLAQMAAALFESLLSNHAFLDGNKRACLFHLRHVPAAQWLEASGRCRLGTSFHRWLA
jgi:prophage maintenance system killer protein